MHLDFDFAHLGPIVAVAVATVIGVHWRSLTRVYNYETEKWETSPIRAGIALGVWLAMMVLIFLLSAPHG